MRSTLNPTLVDTGCNHVPQRFLMCGMIFAATVIAAMDRQVYFQAISTIVYVPKAAEESKSECPAMMSTRGDLFSDSVKSRFIWDAKVLKSVTQVFYMGFLISNVPAGCLADQQGGRGVLGVGLLVGSVITLLMPTLLLQGPMPLIVARFIQGMAQGLTFSSTYSLIAQWTPTSERTRVGGIISAGGAVGWGLGYVVALLFREMWQLMFYLTGATGLLLVLVWYHFSSSCPSHSDYVTDAELLLIMGDREGLEDQFRLGRGYQSKLNRVPWTAILTSPPVWSLLLINWAFSWIHYTMFNQFRSYSVNVLRITGDLSSLGAMFMEGFTLPMSIIIWSFVSDYVVNKKYISRTVHRKMMGVTSNMLMIPCLLGIPLVGCNGLAVFSINVAFNYFIGMFFSTMYVNSLDLSPKHAGLLNGFIFSTGVVTALFSREMAHSVLDVPSDISKWYILFLWMSALLVVLSLPYLWFGSAEVQPWNSALGPVRSMSVAHHPRRMPLVPSHA